MYQLSFSRQFRAFGARALRVLRGIFDSLADPRYFAWTTLRNLRAQLRHTQSSGYLREMTSLGTSVLCIGTVANGLLLAAQLRAADRPNIVLIMLDDAGYGDLSCYGQQKFSTPNVDRLATEGMRFTHHYSGSTVCAPTRCVLMTGMHTGHCHIRGNREVSPEGQAPLLADTPTMARLLKRAGYATGCFGKWGLGAPGSEGDPTQQGFDEFYGYNCQRQAHSYYPTHLWHNTTQIPLDGKTYSHDLIMAASLEFIRTHSGDPFFCFLPITIPHAAMQVPEAYAAPFRKIFPQFERETGRFTGPAVKNPAAAFAGMMTKMDDGMGEVLALLEELRLADNTIVLFTSDNGPHREGGHDPGFFNSSGSLRGLKRDLFEGGIRTPLLARWPGHVVAGAESDLLCAHWDLLPTLCALAGAAAPPGIDGISIAPTLLGESDAQQHHEFLYWEFYEQGGKRAVRFGDWKVTQLDVLKKADGPLLVFDLAKDPGEQHNVAATQAEVVARAKRYFAAAHVPSAHWKFNDRR